MLQEWGGSFYSEWTQELLYTFIKVPGAMRLENSRPVGLLEILQKASYAFDYAAITDVWERKGCCTAHSMHLEQRRELKAHCCSGV